VINIKLEGTYTLQDNLLIKEGATLKLGLRHRAKKGQAKRFIGFIDPTKPEEEQFSYISSLYSKQGSTKYTMEYQKQNYDLAMTGINQVVISRAIKEPVLVYKPSELAGSIS
jgi:hypothetical protein